MGRSPKRGPLSRGTQVSRGMQTAFRFLKPAPSARPLVFPSKDRAGARPATDARVAAVVKRVVRDRLFADQRPHVSLGPIRQRTDFDELELLVPTDDRGFRTVGALVPPNRTRPPVPPAD